MKSLALPCAIFVFALAASANPRIFKGQIMDSECATNAHSATHSHTEMAGSKATSQTANVQSCASSRATAFTCSSTTMGKPRTSCLRRKRI